MIKLLGAFRVEEFQEISAEREVHLSRLSLSLRLSFFAPRDQRKNAARVREHGIYSRYISPRSRPAKDDVFISFLSRLSSPRFLPPLIVAP